MIETGNDLDKRLLESVTPPVDSRFLSEGPNVLGFDSRGQSFILVATNCFVSIFFEAGAHLQTLELVPYGTIKEVWVGPREDRPDADEDSIQVIFRDMSQKIYYRDGDGLWIEASRLEDFS